MNNLYYTKYLKTKSKYLKIKQTQQTQQTQRGGVLDNPSFINA